MIDTIALDRRSYAALKNKWMRCKVDPDWTDAPGIYGKHRRLTNKRHSQQGAGTVSEQRRRSVGVDNMKTRIFVFGSNLAGHHGAGAAKFARDNHGAEYGIGNGRTGFSYAIPTKDHRIETLPLPAIKRYVDMFISYAAMCPDLDFDVTAIGCGLAGYKPREIAPMFDPAIALENVYLPAEFCQVLATTTRVSFGANGERISR